MAGPCSPKHGPAFVHGVEKFFSFKCYAATSKDSSLWLGHAPQHPLSRPSSFRSVKDPFRGDVMDTYNNVQMNGWSCSSKQDPAPFTVLNNLFVLMVCSFSQTIKFMAGPCSPKHGAVSFTVLKNFFVWMLLSHLKPFKLMSGLRSPKSLVTDQLKSRRSRSFS